MFTRKDSWICFADRPILSLEPGGALFSSGCGGTEVSSSTERGLRVHGRMRTIQYHAASHSLTANEVRILLAAAGQPDGARLLLTREGDACRIRVEGLPWDHNRVTCHLAVDGQDTFYPGGTLYGEDSEPEPAWTPGTHTVWANARNLYPVSGFYSKTGLSMSVEGGTLVRFTVPRSSRAANRPFTLGIELWGTDTPLILTVEADAQSARTALQTRTATRLDMPNPALALPTLQGVRGGDGAVHSAAASAAGSAGPGMLVPEDWQGMRHTVIGGMSDCMWQADTGLYPHLPRLCADLQALGVPCALPVLPVVNLDTEMFREAAVRGYCLVGKKGGIWQDKRREQVSAWLDLTQPRVVEWVGQQLQRIVAETGATNIIARMDMPFPVEASAANADAVTLRNEWAARWFLVCRQALQELPGVGVQPDRTLGIRSSRENRLKAGRP